MIEDRLASLLETISRLLLSTGEIGVARTFSELAEDARAAENPSVRQDVIRKVLALYGGMGSFQDLVLQNDQGVLREQRELDDLKSALFEEARRELQ